MTIDLAAMPSWGVIDELRLVANTVKHVEGGSARELKELRPEPFTNPAYVEIYRHVGVGVDERALEARASAPLSGEDLFVTEEILQAYAERCEAFFGEIASLLREH